MSTLLEPSEKTIRTRETAGSWNFAEIFVLSQTFLPALLYLPGSQPYRIPIRLAAYGITLVALLYYWAIMRPRERPAARLHPSVPWLAACAVYLGVMIFHPLTNSWLAGMAQVGLYLSVLAPVVWAPAFVKNSEHLKRLLWLFLICNGINSFVGVMQVRDPDRWMPPEFSSVIMQGEFDIGALIYEGADGTTIVRPPGLGDAPGGVCGPSVFAVYLGLVFCILEPAWWKKAFGVIFSGLGAAAIFFTLVRSSLLIALGMLSMYFLLQVARGRAAQGGSLLLVALGVIGFAFVASSATGGENLVNRFHSIMEDDPRSFYYENRGVQVEDGFLELLPTYPFGAGLGRWGMMNFYFGNPNNAASSPIWVEIQWPGLIVDGGIFLLVAYSVALFRAVRQQWRITFGHGEERVQQLSCVILALNTGLLAHCFSYPIFLSPIGMQFWFLSGAIHGVALRTRLTAARKAAVPAPLLQPESLAVGRAQS